MGDQSPYNMAYTQIRRPTESVYKHSYYGSVPWIPSQSCMQMGTCAKGSMGARAHKALLYEIVDMVRKMKDAIHNVPRALYLIFCFSSRLISPLASTRSLGATAILAKFLLSNHRVWVRIDLRGAIVELAPKMEMASGFWSCEH